LAELDKWEEAHFEEVSIRKTIMAARNDTKLLCEESSSDFRIQLKKAASAPRIRRMEEKSGMRGRVVHNTPVKDK
jgi:hypothetical protein